MVSTFRTLFLKLKLVIVIRKSLVSNWKPLAFNCKPFVLKWRPWSHLKTICFQLKHIGFHLKAFGVELKWAVVIGKLMFRKLKPSVLKSSLSVSNSQSHISFSRLRISVAPGMRMGAPWWKLKSFIQDPSKNVPKVPTFIFGQIWPSRVHGIQSEFIHPYWSLLIPVEQSLYHIIWSLYHSAIMLLWYHIVLV